VSNDIIRIIRDPRHLTKYLKSLDQELSTTMGSLGAKHVESEFLIAGQGSFIPGPSPHEYTPIKKNHALDQILLSREIDNEINSGRRTPKFVGYVSGEDAVKFASEGNIFSEDEQVSRLLLHGKYSHRLALEVIREAVKSGDLNFELESGEQLTQTRFLEMTNKVRLNFKEQSKYYHAPFYLEEEDDLHYESVLWVRIFDSPHDTDLMARLIYDKGIDTIREDNQYQCNRKYFLDPKAYSYSSRSPFVLKSLLTCFGNELKLPNLQSYLLDSHWKQVGKMKMRTIQQDKNKKLTSVSDADLYCAFMVSLSTVSDHPGDISSDFPFTLTPSQARSHPDYKECDDKKYTSSGIKVKKITFSAETQHKSPKDCRDIKNGIVANSTQETEIKAEESDSAPVGNKDGRGFKMDGIDELSNQGFLDKITDKPPKEKVLLDSLDSEEIPADNIMNDRALNYNDTFNQESRELVDELIRKSPATSPRSTESKKQSNQSNTWRWW